MTYGFLRSLARLDLAESRVGALRASELTVDDVPDPPLPRDDSASSADARGRLRS